MHRPKPNVNSRRPNQKRPNFKQTSKKRRLVEGSERQIVEPWLPKSKKRNGKLRRKYHSQGTMDIRTVADLATFLEIEFGTVFYANKDGIQKITSQPTRLTREYVDAREASKGLIKVAAAGGLAMGAGILGCSTIPSGSITLEMPSAHPDLQGTFAQGTDMPKQLDDILGIQPFDSSSYAAWTANDLDENFEPLNLMGDDLTKAKLARKIGYDTYNALSNYTAKDLPQLLRAQKAFEEAVEHYKVAEDSGKKLSFKQRVEKLWAAKYATTARELVESIKEEFGKFQKAYEKHKEATDAWDKGDTSAAARKLKEAKMLFEEAEAVRPGNNAKEYGKLTRSMLGEDTLNVQEDRYFGEADKFYQKAAEALKAGKHGDAKAFLARSLDSFVKGENVRPMMPNSHLYTALTHEKLAAGFSGLEEYSLFKQSEQGYLKAIDMIRRGELAGAEDAMESSLEAFKQGEDVRSGDQSSKYVTFKAKNLEDNLKSIKGYRAVCEDEDVRKAVEKAFKKIDEAYDFGKPILPWNDERDAGAKGFDEELTEIVDKTMKKLKDVKVGSDKLTDAQLEVQESRLKAEIYKKDLEVMQAYFRAEARRTISQLEDERYTSARSHLEVAGRMMMHIWGKESLVNGVPGRKGQTYEPQTGVNMALVGELKKLVEAGEAYARAEEALDDNEDASKEKELKTRFEEAETIYTGQLAVVRSSWDHTYKETKRDEQIMDEKFWDSFAARMLAPLNVVYKAGEGFAYVGSSIFSKGAELKPGEKVSLDKGTRGQRFLHGLDSLVSGVPDAALDVPGALGDVLGKGIKGGARAVFYNDKSHPVDLDRLEKNTDLYVGMLVGGKTDRHASVMANIKSMLPGDAKTGAVYLAREHGVPNAIIAEVMYGGQRALLIYSLSGTNGGGSKGGSSGGTPSAPGTPWNGGDHIVPR